MEVAVKPVTEVEQYLAITDENAHKTKMDSVKNSKQLIVKNHESYLMPFYLKT